MYEAEQYDSKNGSFSCELHAEISEQNGAIVLGTTALAADIAGRYLADPSSNNRKYLAFQFHAAISALIRDACIKIRDNTGLSVCALSGGVFQNRLLTHLCEGILQDAGFTVLRHSLIPPNDGGICLGQALKGIVSR